MMMMSHVRKSFLFSIFFLPCLLCADLPLYYWQQNSFVNFGDYLSLKLVERITGKPIRIFQKKRLNNEKKLLAIGSILVFGLDGDVIWGTGLNGKRTDKSHFHFTHLDVRAVRGPLTRQFLRETLHIDCPEVYGDPALLIPHFFPEFQRKQNPKYDYIIIPHYSEQNLFPKGTWANVVYPTEPWNEVIEKITDSRFVISSSLHGIIVAEAFGIPARFLKVTDHEPLLKYQDYYYGTNRPYFQYATSVEEALRMGGEPPCCCDLEKLYQAFPFEYWENTSFKTPNFR
jgi:pyruvyltransferase